MGGAVGQGVPGPPSDVRRAARGPTSGLVHLPGCRRPPPTAAGLSSADPCGLPSTPVCAPSFRPACAFAARHAKFASLSSQLVSASIPVEFHPHPWACSNSPELRHLENCPCEGPLPPFFPYLQRQALISHHYQTRSPISFTFRFPSLLGMSSYYEASVMDDLSELFGVNLISDIQPEICSVLFCFVFHDLSQSNLPTYTNYSFTFDPNCLNLISLKIL